MTRYYVLFYLITIYLLPQNRPQFQRHPLYSWEISYRRAFLIGLRTASSRWEPNLANTVDVGAIRSPIRVVLSLF